jgi:hypothetical protein
VAAPLVWNTGNVALRGQDLFPSAGARWLRPRAHLLCRQSGAWRSALVDCVVTSWRPSGALAPAPPNRKH